MKEVLIKTDIKREKDKLYYCATAEDGCLTVCQTEMKRRKK